MRARLVTAGLAPERVDVGLLSPVHDAPLVTEILDLTRDQQCATIVVGRNALPWHRELVHHHPADELVRAAHGFTVWVVE